MPSFRCLYIESDKPEAAMQLLSAFVGAAPAAVIESTDPEPIAALPAPVDDEPVDDELIEIEPEPVRTPRKPRVQKPRPGGNIRDKAAHYIRKHGPSRQSDILRGIGAPKGSGGSIFKDSRFYSDDEQLIHLKDDDTDGEEKPASAPKRKSSSSVNIPDAPAAAVKPKLVALLEKHPAGLSTGELKSMSGLDSRAVQQCLYNHRAKTFVRTDDDKYTLSGGAMQRASPSKQAPAKSQYHGMVAALLKSDQPMELEEIALITKIPRAELFKVLADETKFERDTDGLYWIAK